MTIGDNVRISVHTVWNITYTMALEYNEAKLHSLILELDFMAKYQNLILHENSDAFPSMHNFPNVFRRLWRDFFLFLSLSHWWRDGKIEYCVLIWDFFPRNFSHSEESMACVSMFFSFYWNRLFDVIEDTDTAWYIEKMYV